MYDADRQQYSIVCSYISGAAMTKTRLLPAGRPGRVYFDRRSGQRYARACFHQAVENFLGQRSS